jgi:hypothetical protein
MTIPALDLFLASHIYSDIDHFDTKQARHGIAN